MKNLSNRTWLIGAAVIAVIAVAAFLVYTFLPTLQDRPTLMYFRSPT